MDTPTTTIIIPAYNCEQTIERAVKSVFYQTYSSWKLIIVNDGSTDSTLRICENLAKADPRIHVVNQSNLGPARARNIGIDAVQTKYIAFLDSDDTYEPEFLRLMISALESTNADFAFCAFNKINSQKTYIVTPPPINELREDIDKSLPNHCIGNSLDFLRLFFLGCPCGVASLWNKIYRTDIINKSDIRLEPNRRHGEDWKFNLDFLTSDERLGVVLQDVLYNYYETEGSITQKPDLANFSHQFESARFMLETNDRFNLKCEKYVYGTIVTGLVSYVLTLLAITDRNTMYHKVKSYKSHELVSKSFSKILSLPISPKMKILSLLCYIGKPGLSLISIMSKAR